MKDLHEKLNTQKRQTLQDQKEDSEALNDMKLKFELLMKSYAAEQRNRIMNGHLHGNVERGKMIFSSVLERTKSTDGYLSEVVNEKQKLLKFLLKLKFALKEFKYSMNASRMDIEDLKLETINSINNSKDYLVKTIIMSNSLVEDQLSEKNERREGRVINCLEFSKRV